MNQLQEENNLGKNMSVEEITRIMTRERQDQLLEMLARMHDSIKCVVIEHLEVHVDMTDHRKGYNPALSMKHNLK